MSAVLAFALVYAALAYGAVCASKKICSGIVPFADGPRPGKPPARALLVSAACVGATLASRHASVRDLALAALLTASLVACCYSDIACGIVPDTFTLVPLGAVLAYSALRHDARPVLSALLVLAPFALAAVFSGGLGMGWGDVKLVTLAAAVLGFEVSIVAFSAACFVAAANALWQRRQAEPIAFVPYLAAAAALALALPLTLPQVL
jgi:prepilin signal peptidase PulO-like enzyme (type II secretory pathway)